MQTLTYVRPPRPERRPRRMALAPLCALAFALALFLGVAAYHPLQAHARSRGTTNPVIQWDQSMVYPGQNHGNPEGPIGEPALVHGQNFTAGQQVALVIVPGDSNADATVCKQAGITVAHATATSSGTFDATFTWPDQANQVNQAYSICGLQDGLTVLSSADSGPFTVLSANKPTFSLSASSAAAGSTITVTGQNWVPAQALNITIATCADCDPGNSNIATAATTSLGRNTGTFSVNVSIPAGMAVNNYVVNVSSQNGPLDANHIEGLGTKPLAITAPVATPTPVASPSPSVTAAPSPSAVATQPSTTSNSNSSSNDGGNNPIMLVLIILAIVLLGVGGAIVFLLVRRSKQSGNANEPGGGGSAGAFGASQGNQFTMQRAPMTPFPQNQPMNTPNPFGSSPNNGGYAGFNQQNQGWQNQQGNQFSNQGWQNQQQGNQFSNQGWPNQQQQDNWQNQQQGNQFSNQGWPNQQQGNQFNNQPYQQQGFGAGPRSGGGWPAPNRQCVRCGQPLSPGDLVCGNCGTRNTSVDPNDPTVAY